MLVLEDDAFVRRALVSHLAGRGAIVRGVETVADGVAALVTNPELIILDVQLPDGSGVDLAEAALERRPRPRMIATSGAATAAEAFQLARLNVWRFLQKPYDFDALDTAIAAAPVAEDLAAFSTLCVGQLGLVEAREVLREAMVKQALARSEGNIARAAGLLRVTRQAVQSATRTDNPAHAA